MPSRLAGPSKHSCSPSSYLVFACFPLSSHFVLACIYIHTVLICPSRFFIVCCPVIQALHVKASTRTFRSHTISFSLQISLSLHKFGPRALFGLSSFVSSQLHVCFASSHKALLAACRFLCLPHPPLSLSSIHTMQLGSSYEPDGTEFLRPYS